MSQLWVVVAMSERSRTLQHVYGKMNTAAENIHAFLLDVRDGHGIEMEHGDVFHSTQDDVYDAVRAAHELRQSKPDRTVRETVAAIQRSQEAVDAVEREIEQRDGDVDRLEQDVEKHVESAVERARELEDCHV
jgi:peptidoglycan hydrolase CwlO-like protein